MTQKNKAQKFLEAILACKDCKHPGKDFTFCEKHFKQLKEHWWEDLTQKSEGCVDGKGDTVK